MKEGNLNGILQKNHLKYKMSSNGVIDKQKIL